MTSRCLRNTMLALALAASGAVQAQFTANLLEVSRAWGTATADYNADGRDDIFITGHDDNDRIWYRNRRSYQPGPQVLPYVDRHDCAPADVNRDGRMDFYCALGASGGDGVSIKELWLGNRNGQHTKVQPPVLRDPYGRGRRAIFMDLNRDGWPDLYVANLAEARLDDKINTNRMLINDAGRTFNEVTTIATGQVGSDCLDHGDMNLDGWDDLLLCNENGVARLYLNDQAGDFTPLAAPALGEWIDAKLDDVNGDGRDDLLAITRDNRLQVWLNTGTAPYYDTPAFADTLPALATSLAVVDFNRDGQADVYVTLQDAQCATTLVDLAPDRVYFGAGPGNWVPTVLEGTLRGCGTLVDALDGTHVVVMNGTVARAGPNYVVSYDPTPGVTAALQAAKARPREVLKMKLKPADEATATQFLEFTP